jgi:hypothetical protein
MATYPNEDGVLLRDAWSLVIQFTNQVATILDYAIIEWPRPHRGETETYVRGWALIGEEFETELQGIQEDREVGHKTSQELITSARAAAREVIQRLRPSARLRKHLIPSERLDPEVEFTGYMVAAEKFAKGIRQLLRRYEGPELE